MALIRRSFGELSITSGRVRRGGCRAARRAVSGRLAADLPTL